MMKFLRYLFLLFSLAMILALMAFRSYAPQPQNDSKFHPIFSEEAPLQITLMGDMKSLLKDRGDESDYHPFQFIADGTDSLPVKIKIRGNFRRQRCKLPPLRLNFSGKTTLNTRFEGLDKVKMVVPCRWDKGNYRDFIAAEYLVYKGYNLITDTSFQVRWVDFTIIDSLGKVDTIRERGFIIEPLELLAARLGGKEDEVKYVHPNQTMASTTNHLSVYQYMVGNTDWSIPGVHNIKMVRTEPGASPIIIPYDFDWSGIINAPYANPDPTLGINSVTQRVYRGFCRPEAEMERTFARFRAAKEDMYALYQRPNMLSPKMQKYCLKYLDGFYDILESDKLRKRHFFELCRTAN
ncbi:MAG: hypothetical protein AAFO96_02410 [Bacteroidota bacterium]